MFYPAEQKQPTAGQQQYKGQRDGKGPITPEKVPTSKGGPTEPTTSEGTAISVSLAGPAKGGVKPLRGEGGRMVLQQPGTVSFILLI